MMLVNSTYNSKDEQKSGHFAKNQMLDGWILKLFFYVHKGDSLNNVSYMPLHKLLYNRKLNMGPDIMIRIILGI